MNKFWGPMVSKVILEYGKNGFCLHISHKKVGLIKKDLLAKKQDLFETKCEEKSLLWKKGFMLQKTGIAKAKKYKKQDLSEKKRWW